MKAIVKAQIITTQKILQNYAVIFDDKITHIIPEEALIHYDVSEKINAQGLYLSAGFIDIHVHGCAGIDTMDERVDGITLLSEKLAQTGVTAFLPTTMTMRFDQMERTFIRIRTAMGNAPGAQVLGCHLEGPFINKNFKGAQDSAYILPPDFGKVKDYVDVIKIITMAPEWPESAVFIRRCIDKGMTVALGHSAISYEEAMASIKEGVSHITHIFNALTPFHHRHPGVVGAAADSDVTCELIADNIHVHPAAQRLLLKIKGFDKIILITDAMRASLMSDGKYDFGGQIVTVQDGKARLASGVIAGSVLTLNQAVFNFKQTSGLDLAKVISMVTVNPAERLGIAERKGSIAVGKDADMVIFDDTLAIHMTIVRGKTIYRR
jgi:N-acetylglucosamine-6-phosphate deacetylase